jgi:hypothetical protein
LLPCIMWLWYRMMSFITWLLYSLTENMKSITTNLIKRSEKPVCSKWCLKSIHTRSSLISCREFSDTVYNLAVPCFSSE